MSYPDYQTMPQEARHPKSWHFDQAESWLVQAEDSRDDGNGRFSEWCQRQALVHATLAKS